MMLLQGVWCRCRPTPNWYIYTSERGVDMPVEEEYNSNIVAYYTAPSFLSCLFD